MNKQYDGANTDALGELYATDSDAKSILDWFGSRQKDAREIAVGRASTMAKVDHLEVIRVFRKFAELGCGRFMVGRRGAKSRMVFDLSIRSLAAAASAQNGAAIREIDFEDVEELLDAEEEEYLVDFMVHRFQLRSNVEIQIKLPTDLSGKEAERLAIFVKSLPF